MRDDRSWIFSARGHSPLRLPPGELLPGSHPADEDEQNVLLVSGLPVFPALCPPGGALPAQQRRPPVRDSDQRHCCGHGREKQLLWGISHQLDDEVQDGRTDDLRKQKGSRDFNLIKMVTAESLLMNPANDKLLRRLSKITNFDLNSFTLALGA